MPSNQIRHAALISGNLRAEPGEKKYLEGYFAVFNNRTQLWPGVYEEVDPEAFNETMGNDIRVLINHDTTLVLGRNKAGTAEFKIDARGLWGRVEINEKDSDAVNAYERVQRGDVDQCSFGFNILDEEINYLDNGDVVFRLKKVDLHEGSICTFPAYPETSIQARQKDLDLHKRREIELKKAAIRKRLGGK
jgi:hypothetical protein